MDIFTDSSDAPNFNETTVTNPSPNNHKSRIIVEEGRDKVVFNEVSECVCNLIGRDFTEDEHILESRDISTVTSINYDYAHVILLFFLFPYFSCFSYNRKFLHVGKFTLIGFYFTAAEVTDSLLPRCIIN